jgi:hypothetical protein
MSLCDKLMKDFTKDMKIKSYGITDDMLLMQQIHASAPVNSFGRDVREPKGQKRTRDTVKPRG